jgi:hypothetical protein
MFPKASQSLLCFPFAAVMLLQGSSCKSSVAKNSANTPSPMSTNSPNATASATPDSRALPPGMWGGMHVSLEVTAGGANLDFDCAHGEITQRIIPGPDGKFAVRGTYAAEHGGPVRQEESESSAPASYRGKVDGDTMTLAVILTNSDTQVGAFTLTRGEAGRVMKCK